MRIIKPTDNRYCKATIFAPAGAGKTVLIGTAQEDERTFPMLVLDFEGGTESLAGLDIDVAPIHSWDDYNEVYEALANGETVDGIDFTQYKSLGIDSISETHKFALLEILRREGPSRRDPDLVEQGDYGRATTQMRRLLREFRDLPLHVFFVAHAKEVEIPREGRVRIPDLAGQMAEEISGLTSMQGYLAQYEEDGEKHRTLLLHSFPKFRIKARTRWRTEAPEEIIDPTITKVLDALGYGDDSQYEEDTRSSRGKQVDDTVPVDEEGRLPGRDAAAGDLPGGNDEEDESSESDNETTETPADASSGAPDISGDDNDEGSDLDLEAMTLAEMKRYAADNDIDLNGARTRSKAREAILNAE